MQLGYSSLHLAIIFTTEKTPRTYEKNLRIPLKWVAGHLRAALITLRQAMGKYNLTPTSSH
jgi:hypothetical protein